MTSKHTVPLPTGERVPALGLGTWKMGESARARDAEIAAVRHAVDLGYRLFDTAEMYGDGGAETVLGRALADAMRANVVGRDEIVVVSKVYPHNASRRGVPQACDRSRKRLGLDVIDVYLLHWRGAVPLAETVDAFEALKAGGAIRAWGVSNFDVDDLRRARRTASDADREDRPIALRDEPGVLRARRARRGVQPDAVPAHRSTCRRWRTARSAAAASPTTRRWRRSRRARGATAAQVALAWTMRAGDVIAIPKAVDPAHLADNFASLDVVLDDAALAAIDARFPPPDRKAPLAMV